jgi:hypothetical protein
MVLLVAGALGPRVALGQGAAQEQEAATRPSGELQTPTTRPEGGSPAREGRRGERRQRRSESPAPAVLPAIFDVVAARNIFVKGSQRPPVIDPTSSGSAAATSVNVPVANQLVLTGISLEDNQKVAFLEDQQADTSLRVKIGDPIANGKVVNITLDALDYRDASGRTIRVQVGFNLAGGDVWGVSSTATASTQPSRTGPRQPGESIEDYLRRRRASELNH